MFSATFGAKFIDLWKDTNLDEVREWWAANLADLSDAELRRGVDAIINGKAFPPTLPEFRTACRPPIRLPHVDDHASLSALAADLGINTTGIPSYAAVRSRIQSKLDRDGGWPMIEDRRDV